MVNPDTNTASVPSLVLRDPFVVVYSGLKIHFLANCLLRGPLRGPMGDTFLESTFNKVNLTSMITVHFWEKNITFLFLF